MTDAEKLKTYEYYREPSGVIYCGDCREILPLLNDYQTVLTDPVWPNALPSLIGSENPYELFRDAMSLINESAERVIVHLGVDSDPRFLSGVPTRFNFFRVVQLRYGLPSYKGRILYDRDIGYLFGTPPISTHGNHLITGDIMEGRAGKESSHPTPRKLKHVQFMVQRFSNPGDVIVDPFCGGGTTLRAAKNQGRKFIGIEIEPKYCELAKQRLAQEELF